MAVVRRNRPEDVRAMPQLLGITTKAIQDGGCDFLGQVVVDLQLLNTQMGQFFTPYDVSRMIAEMSLGDAGALMQEKGFVTLMEPASGAGGMIIAAADVIARHGFDIGRQLYVDATDVSPMCFRMTYLQTALRGVPATVRRGNSLSLEVFDQAVTPAFLPFYQAHREAFDAWQRGPQQPPQRPPAASHETAPPPERSPVQPTRYKHQPGLFD